MKSSIDPLRYYDLELFLFEDIYERFHGERSIGAFDLFSIVRWKANRAKPRIAQRLRMRGGTLEKSSRRLSAALYRASSDRERLRILMRDWGFSLPMASAILAVLWPDKFTVYDVRVCDELKRFHALKNWTDPDKVWAGYCAYRGAVRRAAPCKKLRDKDRYLWGRSALRQLQRELRNGFSKPVET